MSAIDMIKRHDGDAFFDYCEETKNTIYGRHSIGILLAMLSNLDLDAQTELVAYDQSKQVVEPYESSTSYASLVTSVPTYY